MWRRSRAGYRRDGPSREIAYVPARVLMQAHGGIPDGRDLAAMRDAMGNWAVTRLASIRSSRRAVSTTPLQVDAFGTHARRCQINADREFKKHNQDAMRSCAGASSCRYTRTPEPCTRSTSSTSARVVFTARADGAAQAYPDTLVGTDSHTTMVKGLGVLRMGRGGQRGGGRDARPAGFVADAQVIGVHLSGELGMCHRHRPRLHITQMLRKKVVGKFVEFFGPGLRGCRSPTARRSRTWRGAARDLRDVPDRHRDAPLPAVHGTRRGAGCARRGLRARAGDVPRARLG